METFNPTAAFKPKLKKGVFDYEQYLNSLGKTLEEISKTKNGKEKQQQYLEQEVFKTRYLVAQELKQRAEARKSNLKRTDKITELVDSYNLYLTTKRKTKTKTNSRAPKEPDYNLLAVSPVFKYENDLGLSVSKKIELMKKIVRFLRKQDIFVIFSKTIKDEEADSKKETYIKLNKNGERDLPIGELVGNKILINVWNVDFISSFLTIGHLYGHMVQEMHLVEIQGIREFLAYPKPLDLKVVQKNYKSRYGRGDYRSDFKKFEEEAFAYAKYAFQKAGIVWNKNIEYAMRIYIETDFDELWRWATQAPEKEAKSFMDLYLIYYDKYKGKFPELFGKKVDIKIYESESENISVVRDGNF